MNMNILSKQIAPVAVIALLLLSFTKLDAQKMEFGLRFMPTFSSFEVFTPGNGRQIGDYTNGYGFGAILGFNFTDHVGIQVEAIYSAIGQKYTEVDVERKINLKYVNVPLLLSLNTGKSKVVNFNLVGGPQIGVSVGSNIFTKKNGNDNTAGVLSVKKGDLGFAYGAGLDFGINSARTTRIGLGFRGVQGLFDISDNNSTLSTDGYYLLDRTKVKTYAVYAGLSFLF
jgi:hypothetical protein